MNYKVGQKVSLKCGGYGGLNFNFLNEEGYFEQGYAIIISIHKNGSYIAQLPSGDTVGITDLDIKQPNKSIEVLK